MVRSAEVLQAGMRARQDIGRHGGKLLQVGHGPCPACKHDAWITHCQHCGCRKKGHANFGLQCKLLCCICICPACLGIPKLTMAAGGGWQGRAAGRAGRAGRAPERAGRAVQAAAAGRARPP